MNEHPSIRTALVLGAALAAAGPAAAQLYPVGGWYRSGPTAGYTVRAWGLYGGEVLPPGLGAYEAYYPSRPIVTVTDPWGRLANVPLRPKVLYYSDQLLTPRGSFYPTSVVVMPDDRRPRLVPAAPRVSFAPAPVVREGSAPTKAQPPAANLSPAPTREPPLPPPTPLPDREPKVLTPEPPDLKAAGPDRPGNSALPAVPALPKLPDVPPAPDRPKPAADRVPKLGPTPLDAVPPPRPAK
jgi:hypothetical protein